MRHKREPVPYANATSGGAARDEIIRMLRRFGCESVGFMDDFDKHAVLLQFTHQGRQVQMQASALGWAAMFMKAKPFTGRGRQRGRKPEYERKALMQGLVAVNSILRDWVKGQLTAVECGMMSFEAVFMPHVMLADGRSMIEHVIAAKMLPAPRGAA
jgi:hypothetical protein